MIIAMFFIYNYANQISLNSYIFPTIVYYTNTLFFFKFNKKIKEKEKEFNTIFISSLDCFSKIFVLFLHKTFDKNSIFISRTNI